MAVFFDGNGNEIQIDGGNLSQVVAPKNCTFFEGEYPTFSNLFNPESIAYGLLSATAGTVDGSNTGWFYNADPINVEGRAYLYCERYTSAGVTEFYVNRVAFYDADMNFISGASVATAAIAVPEGAKYVRCCWADISCAVNNYPYNLKFHFVGVADDNSAKCLPFEYYYANKYDFIWAEIKPENIPMVNYSPFRGKHLVVFGDSLMDGYGGHTLHNVPYNGDDSANDLPLVKICHEFGMTLDNRAKSGSNISTHVTQGYTNVNGKAMLDVYITEVNAGTAKAPDYMLIAFGTNEYTANAGTAENTSGETDYFSGAMKYFIETVRTNFPGCVFGFVLPPQCDWSLAGVTYKSPAAARDAALAVLAQDGYAVPYIDMWTESGITADMASDGVHVNREGTGKILYYHALRRFMLGL